MLYTLLTENDAHYREPLQQQFPDRHGSQTANHSPDVARQAKAEKLMPDQANNNAGCHNCCRSLIMPRLTHEVALRGSRRTASSKSAIAASH